MQELATLVSVTRSVEVLHASIMCRSSRSRSPCYMSFSPPLSVRARRTGTPQVSRGLPWRLVHGPGQKGLPGLPRAILRHAHERAPQDFALRGLRLVSVAS